MMFIPAPYRTLASVVMGLVLLAAAAGSGWYARGVVADRDIAELNAQIAQMQAKAAEQSQELEKAARKTETLIAKIAEDEANAERIAQAKRKAAADRARAAAVSLRNAAKAATDALAARVADAATPADRSETISGAGLVFADVFGSCGARLAELARQLDEARAAGQICERIYDGAKQRLEDQGARNADQ